jgi:hypothetical protein
MFEDQMRALEQQQAQELLSLPHDPNAPNGNSLQHLAASAPATPLCVNAALNKEHFSERGTVIHSIHFYLAVCATAYLHQL